MKQVKILYEKCKKKMPNRPPDEIDFGLGFRAGLDWILLTYQNYMYDSEHFDTSHIIDVIEKELQ